MATEVYFPNPRVGILLKVFALNFRRERIFSCSLFLRLRLTQYFRKLRAKAPLINN